VEICWWCNGLQNCSKVWREKIASHSRPFSYLVKRRHWFKLNSLKCKELRIDFRRKANVDIPALEVNTDTFETVKSAKVLDVNLTDDLKRNDRETSLRKHLWVLFAQTNEARRHWPCRRIVLEYASQAFCAGLFVWSDRRIQRRALRIVYPELSYREALADANLMSLFERREHLFITLF